MWRWDEVNTLQISSTAARCLRAEDTAVLGGANALAVQNEDGEWEVLQFGTATLTAPNDLVAHPSVARPGGKRRRHARSRRIGRAGGGARRRPSPASSRAKATSRCRSTGFTARKDKPISDPSYQSARAAIRRHRLAPAVAGSRQRHLRLVRQSRCSPGSAATAIRPRIHGTKSKSR